MTETSPIEPNPTASRLYAPRQFNRRSRQRFAAARTEALIRHLGRRPPVPEQILVSRIIRLEFELRKYDDAVADGVELSGHALRARLAAENRLRLDLKALGFEAAAPYRRTVEDVRVEVAAMAARSGAAA
jgi:hypothetical protein